MKREVTTWTIEEVRKRYLSIEFPEFQREPNIWNRRAKQKLIDSIMRGFDVSAIYLYDAGDENYECIDGRQRLGSIMSFLGETDPGKDEDHAFIAQISNEIFTDDGVTTPFNGVFHKKTWAQLEAEQADSDQAVAAIRHFLGHKISVVILSDPLRPEEFNLQFTRLNIGMTINAGEKLNAMVGFMRNLCFTDPRVGQHPFLRSKEVVAIPERRFAREQVASHIMAQIVETEGSGPEPAFVPIRHIDLQKFFQRHDEESEELTDLADRTEGLLDSLRRHLSDNSVQLRSRAVTVSVVFLAWSLEMGDQGALATEYGRFIARFLDEMKTQLASGHDFDRDYQYLIEFQRHVTQASVEKAAITARHKTLKSCFAHWRDKGVLPTGTTTDLPTST